MLSAEYAVVMFGASQETNLTSCQNDILVCSETLVSEILHVSELVPGFASPCLIVPGRMPRAQGSPQADINEMYDTYHKNTLGV